MSLARSTFEDLPIKSLTVRAQKGAQTIRKYEKIGKQINQKNC